MKKVLAILLVMMVLGMSSTGICQSNYTYPKGDNVIRDCCARRIQNEILGKEFTAYPDTLPRFCDIPPDPKKSFHYREKFGIRRPEKFKVTKISNWKSSGLAPCGVEWVEIRFQSGKIAYIDGLDWDGVTWDHKLYSDKHVIGFKDIERECK